MTPKCKQSESTEICNADGCTRKMKNDHNAIVYILWSIHVKLQTTNEQLRYCWFTDTELYTLGIAINSYKTYFVVDEKKWLFTKIKYSAYTTKNV